MLDLITNKKYLSLGYSYNTDVNITSSLRIITPYFFKRNNAWALDGPMKLPGNVGELLKNVKDLYQAIFKTWSVHQSSPSGRSTRLASTLR